ncbi:MAG: hypothetical protein ACRBN8_05680 [Nannocystales bacterium]
MMSDPTRLLDDPAIGASLRADLAQAKSVVLEGLNTSAGAASLSAALSGETAATATVAAGAGISKVLALGAAGAATVGALTWFAVRDPEPDPGRVAAPDVVAVIAEATEPPAPAQRPEMAAVVVPPNPPAVQSPPPIQVPTAQLQTDRSLSEPEVSELKAVPSARKRTPKAGKRADYLREARLISDARAALKTDASGALELLEKARSEFPRGLLAEERDALTILSLAKLGRSEQAKASAKRFLGKHDKSPYAAAVRQVLD